MENRNSSKGFRLVLGCLLTLCGVGIIPGVTIVYSIYQVHSALDKFLDQPVIERVNIRGDQKPELFIDYQGKRFYAEVDGRSIEEYLK